jgi:hypothetical protein
MPDVCCTKERSLGFVGETVIDSVDKMQRVASKQVRIEHARMKALSSMAMQLVIKAHKGDKEKTLLLNVDRTDTVATLKGKIQDMEGTEEKLVACSFLCYPYLGRGRVCAAGCPASQQILVLGTRLEDDRSLADYDIFDKTTIHMRMVRPSHSHASHRR